MQTARIIPFMKRNSVAEFQRRRQMVLDAWWRMVFWWVPR